MPATLSATVTANASGFTTILLSLSGLTGTAPYSIQFRQAPDVNGAPGTFADLGGTVAATTRTVPGLPADQGFYFRAIVTDSASPPATTTVTTGVVYTYATFSLTINPPTINLGAAPGSIAIGTLTVSGMNLSMGPVAFSASDLPTGVSVAFAPATLNILGGTATMTLTRGPSASPGTVPVTITAKTPEAVPYSSASVAVSVTIAAPPVPSPTVTLPTVGSVVVDIDDHRSIYSDVIRFGTAVPGSSPLKYALLFITSPTLTGDPSLPVQFVSSSGGPGEFTHDRNHHHYRVRVMDAAGNLSGPSEELIGGDPLPRKRHGSPILV